jgi:hypothetical protein
MTFLDDCYSTFYRFIGENTIISMGWIPLDYKVSKNQIHIIEQSVELSRRIKKVVLKNMNL